MPKIATFTTVLITSLTGQGCQTYSNKNACNCFDLKAFLYLRNINNYFLKPVVS